jgi:2-polyprenyl-3-methyl-5-hydroxy-6-metoxy-1,4-benzoquinol methylase
MKIFCKYCNEELVSHKIKKDCAFVLMNNDGINIFSNEHQEKKAEEITRDKQANGYLKHDKLPSQSKFFNKFLSNIKGPNTEKVVLDLGCGPGPTVKILVENGFSTITAIDFSESSLHINKNNTSNQSVNWIRADLQQIHFEKNTVDVLIMADFIQHVGSHQDKLNLLINSLSALKSGGYFYFSFFNFNLYNYLKGDLHGSFANGTIPYERLIPSEFIDILSKDLNVTKAYPMNITHNYKLDSFLGTLPFSKLAAKMFAIEGIKK